MTSEYDRENLSHYKTWAEFVRDEAAAMDREEERRRYHEGNEENARSSEDSDDSDTEEQRTPSFRASPAPRYQLPVPARYQQPINTPFIPPTIVQQQAGVMNVTSTGPHDRDVFSNSVVYQYGTRNNPEIQTVVGQVAHVVNTLYVRVDELETINAMLLARLNSVQVACATLYRLNNLNMRRASRYYQRDT